MGQSITILFQIPYKTETSNTKTNRIEPDRIYTQITTFQKIKILHLISFRMPQTINKMLM